MPEEIPFRASGRSGGVPPPLPGWVRLTPAYFDSIDHRMDLSQYFDGAAPDWRDITHPQLAARPVVEILIRQFDDVRSAERPRIHLIYGASGEGKSTAVMQSARQLALQVSFDAVYWRRSLNATLSSSQIASLSEHFQYILFASDNAESLIESVDEILNSGIAESSVNPHFLLAARDTDWVAETRIRGWRVSARSRWLGKVSTYQESSMDTVDINDSRVITTNWVNCSGSLPASVSSLSPALRAEELRSASTSRGRSFSLLGGLLSTRFTPEQLQSRLSSLLERVAVQEPGATFSLADLLIALAAIDLAGIEGIPPEIAAEYLSISPSDLRPLVEVPLRREFAISVTSRAFHSRHPLVSEAILKEALDDQAAFDVESAIFQILDAVNRAISNDRYRAGYGPFIDLGRRLAGSTGSLLKASDLPVRYTWEAVTIFPRELSNRISLSKLLRESDRANTAIEEVWQPILTSIDDQSNWFGHENYIRGAWHEISTVIGVEGYRSAAYILALRSLSDRYAAPLTITDIEYGLNSLAYEAFHLHEADICTDSCERVIVAVDSALSALRPGTRAASYVDDYRTRLGLSKEVYEGPAKLILALISVLSALPAPTMQNVWLAALNDQTIQSLDKLRTALDRIRRQKSS
jgi:hypothetical protein